MSTVATLKVFFYTLPIKRKKQLAILVMLNILCSMFDLVSIAAVGPFILALTRPEIPFSYLKSLNLQDFLSIYDPSDIALPVTLAFLFLIFSSALLRTAVLYIGVKFSFSLGAEISSRCFRAYLYSPYEEVIGDHTSNIVNNIFSNVNLVIYQILNPIILFFSGLSLIIMLSASMLIINPIDSILVGIFLTTSYIFLYGMTKKRVRENGKKIDQESIKVVKAINDGIGGIRDIIIDATQKTFIKIHASGDFNLRWLQGSNYFISAVPKIAIEAVAMILVAIVGFVISRSVGITAALPTLAVVVMIGQKLLPALQQCYVSINSINSSISVLKKINDLLILDSDLTLEGGNKKSALMFYGQISLKNVEFKPQNSERLILRQINLNIRKGERVGLIGKTGSGKSTLVDLVMGLLTPTYGTIEVDSARLTSANIDAWRSMIAHVPQSIFLIDDSIKNNIAFGVPSEDIDEDKVIKCLRDVQLTELINCSKDGIDSIIGERGAFLSGGQRQRIGIARALYKNSQILIFDEATSALDSETESSLMDCIYDLNSSLTVIIIAHKLSILKRCDRIIKVESGRIKTMGSYEDMVGK